LGGNPFDQADIPMLKEASPINVIDQFKAPILLTTGSKDRRVPKRQIDRMATALADAGKDVTYFYYPVEGHDYRDPGSWISFWSIAEKFLANHIGGRFETRPGDKEIGNYLVVQGKFFIDSVN
jgi:dipeptidyl aminopeptidase/acylaminoacyl peptidase